MISTSSIIFMCLTAFVTILGPLIIAIIFYRKTHYALRAVFTGMLVFFLFQSVIRIPLIQIAKLRMV